AVLKEELIDLLTTGAAFSVLSPTELEDLAAAFEPQRYTVGQTVVQAGDDSDSFQQYGAVTAKVIAISPKAGGEDPNSFYHVTIEPPTAAIQVHGKPVALRE